MLKTRERDIAERQRAKAAKMEERKQSVRRNLNAAKHEKRKLDVKAKQWKDRMNLKEELDRAVARERNAWAKQDLIDAHNRARLSRILHVISNDTHGA